MISLARTIVASTSLLVAVQSSATPIGGIEFPQGAISFADLVVSYMPGSDVGGTYMGPAEALGTPDYNDSMEEGAVSLGEGGSLTVAFTDNSLTTSCDSEKDLWIFEIGSYLFRQVFAVPYQQQFHLYLHFLKLSYPCQLLRHHQWLFPVKYLRFVQSKRLYL